MAACLPRIHRLYKDFDIEYNMKLLYYYAVILALCFGLNVSFTLKPEVYCGRSLADILTAVCAENSSEFVKRDTTSNHYESKTSRSRKRRGILDECCLKGCTILDIATYC
ncbi:hypothetical protein K1T71_009883 [Dendrolimus kikuchii]|uniref:Uncharacterized protein n=1 Tax=Dendrolimus kikuchii TaxID=765133 RepID=A0ACC1CTC2_9NEOP|nr:hypothetical protein K1T71_009883 [Dendrolimus kikuchii]